MREFSDLEIKIGDGTQTLICYVQAGKIVGSVALMHEGRTVAEVARLYVHPDHRAEVEMRNGEKWRKWCETKAGA